MNLKSYKLSKSIEIQNDETNIRLQRGGAMVLGPQFDIKSYLKNINYSAKKEKKNLPPLLHNFYNITKLTNNKKYDLSTINIENSPSKKRNLIRLKSPSIDVSTTLSNNNNSITIPKNKNSSYTLNTINDNISISYDNFKLNKNSSKKIYLETDSNLPNTDVNKKINTLESNEQFNLLKTIRSIKKITDLSRKDKSIKNIMSNRIAFDPKNSNVILGPIRIINDYEKCKQNNLNEKNGVSAFLTENKEISKNNVIINLLKGQKKDYHKIINQKEKYLDKNEKLFEKYENNFSNYSTNQKIVNKKLDDLLKILIIKNRRLIYETQMLRAEARVKEDERQKLLERIDELRIIAKFVTRVLGNNSDVYNIHIIPEYSSELLPNYENISKEVLERFNFLINKQRSNDISILSEVNLDDSESLYHQFHKIETDILNLLNHKEIIKKEIAEIRKEGKKQCDDVIKRIKNLEDEYKICKSIYEREKKEFGEIYKWNSNENKELNEKVKSLYLTVFDIENNIKHKKNVFNVTMAVIEIKNKIIEMELSINKLQMELEEYEKEDQTLLNKAIHNRKNDNKEIKVNLKKEVLAAGQMKKKEEMSIEKIVFIKRKTEPLYQPKKKEKKIIIDPEVIKELENEELLAYE